MEVGGVIAKRLQILGNVAKYCEAMKVDDDVWDPLLDEEEEEW